MSKTLPIYRDFEFGIPQTYTDKKNPLVIIHMGDLKVEARATLYRWDGTVRTVDITSIKWGTNEVADYIAACDPDKYDEIEKAALSHFKTLNNEPEEES